jgi:hypothetical protein
LIPSENELALFIEKSYKGSFIFAPARLDYNKSARKRLGTILYYSINIKVIHQVDGKVFLAPFGEITSFCVVKCVDHTS